MQSVKWSANDTETHFGSKSTSFEGNLGKNAGEVRQLGLQGKLFTSYLGHVDLDLLMI